MKFNPRENYNRSKQSTGYIQRSKAKQEDYDFIGFKSGLEVHQQLLTKEKLFCRCPAGVYQNDEDYDAEIVRHMRPTLSELGEYDGTALMEFKTKKEIVYRLKNRSACTYDIDDTPPFAVNREAVQIAIEIALLSKLNIVGEIHITRKQYLDGSIPTGFQRTAIIGVEGEIPLKNKTIRLIQLSLEEDSCREISDIGHQRIYKTDRLGMPLIETVTYPEMTNPGEVKEACDYIRFLNRSSGKVRTGIGAGREDVNVSCRGGSRVEIKGVAHTKWIPELTHNECYRQWALLKIKDLIVARIKKISDWKISSIELDERSFAFDYLPLKSAREKKEKIIAVNLPLMQGVLSHFTQPGQMFADELSGRLKVIACLEKPNMTHSEELLPLVSETEWSKIREIVKAQVLDSQLIIWGNDEDLKTALETIEERFLLALKGVPNETRKSLPDGTTIFERVLPGADRMYPDTDSAPIPLEDSYIEKLAKNLPEDIITGYHNLLAAQVPQDCYTYIFKKNLYVIYKKIVTNLNYPPVFTGTILGQYLKFVEGHYRQGSEFNGEAIYKLFAFVKLNNYQNELIKLMLPLVFEQPNLDYESILTLIKFKKTTLEDVKKNIPFLIRKFEHIRISKNPQVVSKWVMGNLRRVAIGNIDLKELSETIKNITNN